MKISPINTVISVKSNYLNQKNISFKSSENDVFVKSQAPFRDAKKEIQGKYQSKLSKLRTSRKKTLKQIDNVNMAAATNKEYRQAAEGFSYFINAHNSLKKEKDLKPFGHLYNMARLNNVYTFAMTTDDKVVENCRVVICKDKELGEKCLDALKYYTEALGVLTVQDKLDNTVSDKTLIDLNLVCFDKLSDTFETTDSFQEALLGRLEANKTRFEKSKRPTMLQVENMERLLSKENSKGNIACMKDMMSICWEDYHTVLTFHITDLDNCDPGTTMSHRMAHKYELDKMGITKNDVEKLFFKKDLIGPQIEKTKPLYSRYLVLTKKIEDTKAECKKEVANIAKKISNGEDIVPIVKPKVNAPIKQTVETSIKENTENVVNTAKKSLFKNKNIAIAFGALATIGIVAGLMYNKGKKAVSNQQNNSAFQPINKVEIQPIKKSQNNFAPVSNNAVFAEFQRIV